MSPEEFTALARPHLGVLHRVARRLARTRADAEDLAQEGLVRAFEKRASLKDPSKFRGWLLATLRNLHLNRIRDEKPHLLLLSAGPELDAARGDLDEEMQSRVLSDELLLALRQLPEEQATTLWLRAVEGFSYDEVAEAMETPVGTVRSRLSRARQTMIGLLGERGGRRASGGVR